MTSICKGVYKDLLEENKMLREEIEKLKGRETPSREMMDSVLDAGRLLFDWTVAQERGGQFDM